MKKLSNKKINKTFRDNLITYGMVIAAYVIMQILVSAGSVSSLIQGLLVPLCTYAILAVSLNLTVGILGELSWTCRIYVYRSIHQRIFLQSNGE